ncbi:SGNH/GDSL hydrolase family protein [bacterium]|nr:SGNH/GDSL hydrolase family protein [bacterium]
MLRWYGTLCIHLVNTALLLLFVDFLFWGYREAAPLLGKEENPLIRRYSLPHMKSIYPDYTEEEIRTLLDETWNRSYSYAPYTQFTEAPFTGKFVRVTEEGYRANSDIHPWPPTDETVNIFLFGGSTSFGYGVSDRETLAAALERQMNESHEYEREVRVYNFGRGHYYSTQELMLFRALLRDGFIPDRAIFVDGLNDFYHVKDLPFYTNHLTEYIDGLSWLEGRDVPLSVKVVLRLKGLVFDPMVPNAHVTDYLIPQDGSDEEAREIAQSVFRRYLINQTAIRALAEKYNVTVTSVWQPISTYLYHEKYHAFAKFGLEQHRLAGKAYPFVQKIIEIENPLPELIWCADIQKNAKKNLYVDPYHYSGEMNELVAECVLGETVNEIGNEIR